MKILNFISGSDLGGPKQSFVHYTTVMQQRLGNEVFSLIRKGAPIKSLLTPITNNILEVNYVRSDLPILRSLAANQLNEVIQPLKPDLIICHKQVDITLVRLALGKGCKIIGVVHGFNARHTDKADALIAVSERVKKFLLSSGYLKPVYVVPNMVQLPDNEPQFRPIADMPLIGTMGMFRRKKGMDVLVSALALLKDRGIRFKAILAGGGGYQEKNVKRLAAKLSLSDNIEFRPWLSNEEKWGFLDSLDIFCLPSRSESFGMVVTEAMSRKKVVVATRCGGPEEIIEDGINGYLVENDNPSALADRIEQVIQYRGNQQQIAERAYVHIKDNYSLEAVAPKIEKVISDFTPAGSQR